MNKQLLKQKLKEKILLFLEGNKSEEFKRFLISLFGKSDVSSEEIKKIDLPDNIRNYFSKELGEKEMEMENLKKKLQEIIKGVLEENGELKQKQGVKEEMAMSAGSVEGSAGNVGEKENKLRKKIKETIQTVLKEMNPKGYLNLKRHSKTIEDIGQQELKSKVENILNVETKLLYAENDHGDIKIGLMTPEKKIYDVEKELNDHLVIKQRNVGIIYDSWKEELQEETPPGREKQVKTLKKELPKTYIDKETGKRKESNPWAVSWASYKNSKKE